MTAPSSGLPLKLGFVMNLSATNALSVPPAPSTTLPRTINGGVAVLPAEGLLRPARSAYRFPEVGLIGRHLRQLNSAATRLLRRDPAPTRRRRMVARIVPAPQAVLAVLVHNVLPVRFVRMVVA